MDSELLRRIVDQLSSTKKIQMDSGFGVLVKDYAHYLETNPREDASLFNKIYEEFTKEETASYGGSEFFRPADETGIPSGFAKEAASTVFELESLRSSSIIHEWTSIPGQRLLRRFAAEFKNVICGPSGPYEQFKIKNNLLGQATLPTTIASSILAAGFSVATFWYPIAVYIALLIIKAGLATYCKTGEVGHVG